MKKTYIIAEIGINHNGSLETAKKLIDIAALSGCDAVKSHPGISTALNSSWNMIFLGLKFLLP